MIGADGKHSLLAKAVEPEAYNERPSQMAMYYAYWSGLPVDGFETRLRAEQRRGWAALPTHDDLTCVPFGLAPRGVRGEQEGHRGQLPRDHRPRPGIRRAGPVSHARVEVHRLGRPARLLPQAVRARLGAGRRRRLPQEPDHGDGHQRRVPRRRAGRRRPRRCRSAGSAPSIEAMGAYQEARDAAAMPVYEFTCEFANVGASAAGDAAADRRDAGQPGGAGRLHQRPGGHTAGARVLHARERWARSWRPQAGTSPASR